VGDVGELLLAAAARKEQRQVEAFLVLPFAGLDVDLFDERQRLPCQFPTDTRVCGYSPPAEDAEAGASELMLQGFATALRQRLLVRQEHQSGGEARGVVQGDAGFP